MLLDLDILRVQDQRFSVPGLREQNEVCLQDFVDFWQKNSSQGNWLIEFAAYEFMKLIPQGVRRPETNYRRVVAVKQTTERYSLRADTLRNPWRPSTMPT
jgi:hypothetical protein